MRRTILVEGKRYPDSSFFEPGGVTVEKEVLPIVFEFNMHDPKAALGTARDFQRDENGVLSMEMDIDRAYEELVKQDLDARIYAQKVIRHIPTNTIQTCVIRAISMCISGRWHPLDPYQPTKETT